VTLGIMLLFPGCITWHGVQATAEHVGLQLALRHCRRIATQQQAFILLYDVYVIETSS